MESLRTQYQRLHREAASGSAPEELTKRQAEVIRLLSFLRNQIKTQPSITSYKGLSPAKCSGRNPAPTRSTPKPLQKEKKRKIMVRVILILFFPVYIYSIVYYQLSYTKILIIIPVIIQSVIKCKIIINQLIFEIQYGYTVTDLGLLQLQCDPDSSIGITIILSIQYTVTHVYK